jgi:hypothetical protein
VAYAVSDIGLYDSALIVLEAVWREPLGAISPESLAAGVRVVRGVSERLDQA